MLDVQSPPAQTQYQVVVRLVTGEGKVRNRQNLEWQNWAPQKCAKLCHGVQGSFGRLVGASALCLEEPVVHDILLRGVPKGFGRYCGLPLAVVRDEQLISPYFSRE